MRIRPRCGTSRSGKEQAGRERADIVEGQHLRDEVAELHPVLEDAHEEWDFEPDQRADDEDEAVERQAEILHAVEQKE